MRLLLWRWNTQLNPQQHTRDVGRQIREEERGETISKEGNDRQKRTQTVLPSR